MTRKERIKTIRTNLELAAHAYLKEFCEIMDYDEQRCPDMEDEPHDPLDLITVDNIGEDFVYSFDEIRETVNFYESRAYEQDGDDESFRLWLSGQVELYCTYKLIWTKIRLSDPTEKRNFQNLHHWLRGAPRNDYMKRINEYLEQLNPAKQ